MQIPKRHQMRLEPERTALLVVDVQERLVAAMPEGERARVVESGRKLIEGARILGVPALVTEQYPKGLGHTLPALGEALDAFEAPPPRIEKLEFDVCRNAGVREALDRLERTHVVLIGMEAHICVWQSARGLLEAGYAVHVAADATCSRDLGNRDLARGLWAEAGATVTCTETVLFDLLGQAGGDNFKAISKLVR